MNERIKKLRKALDLTQQEFADKIGMKRNTVANYETDRNEPSNSVISLICREFNVSESWLRTGEGKMFVPRKGDALSELVRQRGLSFSGRVLIEKFLDLKPESRQAVIDYMETVVSALSHEEPAESIHAWAPADAGGQDRTDADIEREVEDFRRRLILEKRQGDTPSPSSEDDATA